MASGRERSKQNQKEITVYVSVQTVIRWESTSGWTALKFWYRALVYKNERRSSKHRSMRLLEA